MTGYFFLFFVLAKTHLVGFFVSCLRSQLRTTAVGVATLLCSNDELFSDNFQYPIVCMYVCMYNELDRLSICSSCLTAQTNLFNLSPPLCTAVCFEFRPLKNHCARGWRQPSLLLFRSFAFFSHDLIRASACVARSALLPLRFLFEEYDYV